MILPVIRDQNTLLHASLVAGGILSNPDPMHQQQRDNPKVLADTSLTIVEALYAEYDRREAYRNQPTQPTPAISSPCPTETGGETRH